MKEATDLCFQMLEKMDKARLNADYHEVLCQIPYNTKKKKTPGKTKLLTKLPTPESCFLFFFMPFLFSPGGKNLQGMHRENRTSFG